MSISTKPVILSRIKSATEASPLAIFITPRGVDCVFASTVGAQVRISSDLLGSYVATVHGGMPKHEVSAILGAHI